MSAGHKLLSDQTVGKLARSLAKAAQLSYSASDSDTEKRGGSQQNKLRLVASGLSSGHPASVACD